MAEPRIAVDAMGGDYAPLEVLTGAFSFARAHPKITVLLFGEEDKMAPHLLRLAPTPANVTVIGCGPSVGMDEGPVDALRTKRDSSVMKAVGAVSNGEADAFVSAGNTGICVAATTLKWRLLPGIPRAGIGLVISSVNGPMVALDLGANMAAKPEHLFSYAVMGSVYADCVLGVTKPRVALLNVGEEEGKGNKLVASTREMLKKSQVNYVGHVEGNHLFDGKADVLVCDGFSGNLILKTAEGVAEFITREIRRNAKKTPWAIAGGLLMGGVFRKLKDKFDYSQYGGAQLLGVDGVCIISHGRSDSHAIYNALKVAADVASKDVNRKIVDGMAAESAWSKS